MARLTLADARRTMQRGRPWTFRLEMHDAAANSHKFWLCTGRGRNEPVEVHYGRVGGKATILVKDWDYVEAKAPEKEAKGYRYAATPFVRVRQGTIDAWLASQATAAIKPAPGGYVAPGVTPAPLGPIKVMPPVQPTPTTWRCDKGGVTMRIKGAVIEIVFDKFPADWQGAVYHTFKDDLLSFCSGKMGRHISTWWGGDNSEIFHARCNEIKLFKALVGWLQKQIGVLATPLIPPPALPGPFGKVVAVVAKGSGVWHAVDAFGDKVLSLTKQGARGIVAEYPHITVAGL